MRTDLSHHDFSLAASYTLIDLVNYRHTSLAGGALTSPAYGEGVSCPGYGGWRVRLGLTGRTITGATAPRCHTAPPVAPAGWRGLRRSRVTPLGIPRGKNSQRRCRSI